MRISDLDTRSAALGESIAYFAVDQASSNVTHKIDYNALAKAIIEQYTGSTIGGSAQSVKAAVDTCNNATTVKNMPSPADFNNYTETGAWRCDLLETAVTNGPPVGTYVSGFLFVSKYNSNNIIQRFCFSASSKDELTRFNWNGTWSAWVKQPTREEIENIALGRSTGVRGPNTTEPYVVLDDGSYDGIKTFINNQINSGDTIQRWFICRVNLSLSAPRVEPTFGSSFSLMFNCSSTKYGWGIIMTDNASIPMMFGQLANGNWTWHKLAYAD